MPWSKEEMMWLEDCFPKLLNIELIPFFIDRSEKSIVRKAEEMRLRKTPSTKFRSMSAATTKKWMRGCFKPEKYIENIRAAIRRRNQTKERNPNWKGGFRPKRDRDCIEYKIWRNSVFKRDGFICMKCGQVGRALEAHHIKQFIHHPEFRYDVSNGITLCVKCHRGIRRREHLWEKYFTNIIKNEPTNI